MNSRGIAAVIIFVGALIVAINLLNNAFTAGTSAISYLVKWGGIGLAAISFMKPRLGVHIVIAEAFLTDYLKKVAVYYGSASPLTIMEVMIVVMLALIATYLGRVVSSINGFSSPASWTEWSFYIGGAVIALLVVAGGMLRGDFFGAVQNGFNSGVYLGVGGLIFGLFRTREAVLRLIRFQLLFAVLWGVWALRQHYFGFTHIEWEYAKTGLSPVATAQMFIHTYERPRVFGLGSGLPNFFVMAPFAALAILLFLTEKNKRLLYGCAAALILWAVVVAKGKTGIIVAMLIPVAFIFFRAKLGTVVAYIAGVGFFGLLIGFAGTLRNNLAAIDQTYRKVLGLAPEWSIQTFTPRLEGYLELKDPKNWSFFGIGEGRNHDAVTAILVQYGAIGMVGLFIIMFATGFAFHHSILTIKDSSHRSLAAIFGAAFSISMVAALMSGYGLFAQPVCLALGTFAGAVFAIRRQNEEEASSEEHSMSEELL
ncbi:MAG: hypothetical protein AAF555_04595 [Verrucomicrobiota bacterium]